jgi:hypothetical protein
MAAHFVVTWRDPAEGKVHHLRVRQVTDSSLGLGFVCLSGFVFERSGVLVDPAEEALRVRLDGVDRLHVNLMSVLTIEERGDVDLTLADRSKILVLPGRDGTDA